jgi:hypothetical protein
LGAEFIAEELGEGLPTLEADIAGETVANDHIHVVEKYLETFERADVVHEIAESFQTLVGIVDQGIPFALFRADGQQADAGTFDPQFHLGIVAAEDCVVGEMYWPGRSTPVIVRSFRVPAETRILVFPVLTTARAWPSLTSAIALSIEESRFRLIAVMTSSAMVMTVGACKSDTLG